MAPLREAPHLVGDDRFRAFGFLAAAVEVRLNHAFEVVDVVQSHPADLGDAGLDVPGNRDVDQHQLALAVDRNGMGHGSWGQNWALRVGGGDHHVSRAQLTWERVEIDRSSAESCCDANRGSGSAIGDDHFAESVSQEGARRRLRRAPRSDQQGATLA